MRPLQKSYVRYVKSQPQFSGPMLGLVEYGLVLGLAGYMSCQW